MFQTVSKTSKPGFRGIPLYVLEATERPMKYCEGSTYDGEHRAKICKREHPLQLTICAGVSEAAY